MSPASLQKRMLADVQAGKLVEWNSRIIFTRSGLELGQRDDSRRNSKPNVIAYDESRALISIRALSIYSQRQGKTGSGCSD